MAYPLARAKSKADYAALVVFLATSFIVAAFGAQFMPGPWYAALTKPSWNPPNWIFGPVWTILYLAMAIAAWRVYLRTSQPWRSAPIVLWFIQMVPNAMWSFWFFGMHRMDWALIDIIILLCLILSTGLLFRRVDSVAGWLFLPYFCWVSFATVLNWTLYWLNKV